MVIGTLKYYEKQPSYTATGSSYYLMHAAHMPISINQSGQIVGSCNNYWYVLLQEVAIRLSALG